MFLKYITPVFFLLVSPTLMAQAGTIIAAGSYELISGEERICQDFSISEKQAQGKQVAIGSFYRFETMNSIHSIESDIDAACEFKEQNRREIVDGKTLLTRINEEFCNGKLRSRTVSIAAISENEISLRHSVGAGANLTCTWKKR